MPPITKYIIYVCSFSKTNSRVLSTMMLLQVITIMENLKPIRVKANAQKGLDTEFAKLKAKSTLACFRVFV